MGGALCRPRRSVLGCGENRFRISCSISFPAFEFQRPRQVRQYDMIPDPMNFRAGWTGNNSVKLSCSTAVFTLKASVYIPHGYNGKTWAFSPKRLRSVVYFMLSLLTMHLSHFCAQVSNAMLLAFSPKRLSRYSRTSALTKQTGLELGRSGLEQG